MVSCISNLTEIRIIFLSMTCRDPPSLTLIDIPSLYSLIHSSTPLYPSLYLSIFLPLFFSLPPCLSLSYLFFSSLILSLSFSLFLLLFCTSLPLPLPLPFFFTFQSLRLPLYLLLMSPSFLS